MKLPGWMPRPASWASGALLYVFSLGVSLAFAIILPRLFELMPHAPRLAWFGIVLLWIAPIPAFAVGHRFAHGVLDLVDVEGAQGREARKAANLWAGFVAWAAILFATSTSAFIMLVLDPPPLDPDALGLVALMTQGVSGGVRSAIWVPKG